MIVGLLHPGQMGAAIGAQLTHGGHRVLWCPQDRSAATAERAESAGLHPIADLADLLQQVDLVLSICPSAAAEAVARSVVDHNYRGLFVDSNALSPERMSGLAATLTERGVTVVDTVISGSPPTTDTLPRIYCAGPLHGTTMVSELLASSGFDVTVLGKRIGDASALKMATASFLRSARILAALAQALADEHSVSAELCREAELLGVPMLGDRNYLPSVAARAWRWVPELRDVAATLAAADLPTGLADASSELYQQLVPAKGDWNITTEQMLALLRTRTAKRHESQ